MTIVTQPPGAHQHRSTATMVTRVQPMDAQAEPAPTSPSTVTTITLAPLTCAQAEAAPTHPSPAMTMTIALPIAAIPQQDACTLRLTVMTTMDAQATSASWEIASTNLLIATTATNAPMTTVITTTA